MKCILLRNNSIGAGLLWHLNLLPVLCCLLISVISIAQTNTIEKLKRSIGSSITDEDKQVAIFALCDVGYNLHPDTLVTYALKAFELSIKKNDVHGNILAMFHLSVALTTKGLIDSSLQLADRCIDSLQKIKSDLNLEAALYNQKGRCFMRKSMYKDAINMGYKVITTAELAQNVLMQIKGKTLIGWAHLEMGRTKEALSWHLSALHTVADTLILEQYGILFANLALNYNVLGNTDSAFYFIEKAITFSRRNENLFALSNSLAIKAQILVLDGKSSLAQAPLKEVVEIRKLIGDPFYIVSDMSQLGLYYANNGQPQNGVAICKEGIQIAEQFNLKSKYLFLYSSLAENYKRLNDFKNLSEVLMRIIRLKDSVYNSNSATELAEMQTLYDLQRRENTIIQQKLQLVQKNYLLYSSILFLLLGAAFSLMLFRSYKKRQHLKMEVLMEQEKQQMLLAVSRAEENERKRIAADLHDNMGAYVSAISANTDELLVDKNTDSELLQNIKNNASQIMLNLRDTIWVLNREEILVTGVSDRFKNYVQKVNRSYTAVSVEIVENISFNISLSPQRALNMLRIMQEGFHNAVKHSHCSKISVEITCYEKLRVTIIDNGIGINENTLLRDGNGLQNMRARAKANNLTLLIKSTTPGGTMLEISA